MARWLSVPLPHLLRCPPSTDQCGESAERAGLRHPWAGAPPLLPRCTHRCTRSQAPVCPWPEGGSRSGSSGPTFVESRAVPIADTHVEEGPGWGEPSPPHTHPPPTHRLPLRVRLGTFPAPASQPRSRTGRYPQYPHRVLKAANCRFSSLTPRHRPGKTAVGSLVGGGGGRFEQGIERPQSLDLCRSPASWPTAARRPPPQTGRTGK